MILNPGSRPPDVEPAPRFSPSGAVVWAVDTLRRRGFPLETAVDVGCGKGRNSLYLAAQGMQVTAMDFTPNAVQALEREARARHLDNRIRALVHDVTEPWPIGRDDIDLVADAFCFRHISPSEARQGYKANLLQVLGSRGHYLIALGSAGDGYYSPDSSPGANLENVEAPSSLFSRRKIMTFFAPELDLLAHLDHNDPETRRHLPPGREAYALLFQRNPRRFVS